MECGRREEGGRRKERGTKSEEADGLLPNPSTCWFRVADLGGACACMYVCVQALTSRGNACGQLGLRVTGRTSCQPMRRCSTTRPSPLATPPSTRTLQRILESAETFNLSNDMTTHISYNTRLPSAGSAYCDARDAACCESCNEVRRIWARWRVGLICA